MSANLRSSRSFGRRSARGFTLIELLVVVIIIGIVALVAIPNMGKARLDRHAYDDAGCIAQLIRRGAARAKSRGTAVLITGTAAPGSDRGTFSMYEAVQPNAAQDGGGASNTPVSTCMMPTVWPPNSSPTAVLVDACNLNGTVEGNANIQAAINDYVSGSVTTTSFCFSGGLNTYYSNASPPVFTYGQPMLGAVTVTVTRAGGTEGIQRTVMVPPSGAARIVSQ